VCCLVTERSFQSLYSHVVTSFYSKSQISSEDWARKYRFDDVIWPHGEPSSVDTMSALARAAVVDAVVFHRPTVVCGAGGSKTGKTQMMFGPFIAGWVSGRLKSVADESEERDLGLLGKIANDILSGSHAARGKCSLSIMEIADDDVLRDVLAFSEKDFDEHDGSKLLHIRHLDNRGATVANLRWVDIESQGQLNQLLLGAFKSAHIRKLWRKERGHGHFIVSIRCESTVIQLVDLASTDRHPSNEQSQDRRVSSIRKSLSSLRGIFRGLIRQDAQIDPSFKQSLPYRESTLTELLQRSLQGDGKNDCRAVIIGNINPSSRSYSQTLATMDFMTRLLARPGDTANDPFGDSHMISSGQKGTCHVAQSLANTALASAIQQNDTGSGKDGIQQSRERSPFRTPVSSRPSSARKGSNGVLLKSIVSDPRQRLAKLLSTAPFRKESSVAGKPKQVVETPISSGLSDDNSKEFRRQYNSVFDQLDTLMSNEEEEVDRQTYGDNLIEALTPIPKSAKKVLQIHDDNCSPMLPSVSLNQCLEEDTPPGRSVRPLSHGDGLFLPHGEVYRGSIILQRDHGSTEQANETVESLLGSPFFGDCNNNVNVEQMKQRRSLPSDYFNEEGNHRSQSESSPNIVQQYCRSTSDQLLPASESVPELDSFCRLVVCNDVSDVERSESEGINHQSSRTNTLDSLIFFNPHDLLTLDDHFAKSANLADNVEDSKSQEVDSGACLKSQSVFVEKSNAIPLRVLLSQDSMESEPLVSCRNHARLIYNSLHPGNDVDGLSKSHDAMADAETALVESCTDKCVYYQSNTLTNDDDSNMNEDPDISGIMETFQREVDAMMIEHASSDLEESCFIPALFTHQKFRSSETSQHAEPNDDAASVSASVEDLLPTSKSECAATQTDPIEDAHEAKEESLVESFLRALESIFSIPAPSFELKTRLAELEVAISQKQAHLLALRGELESTQTDNAEVNVQLQQTLESLNAVSQARQEAEEKASSLESESISLSEQLQRQNSVIEASSTFYGQLANLLGLNDGTLETSHILEKIESLQSKLQLLDSQSTESQKTEELLQSTIEHLHSQISQKEAVRMAAEKLAEVSKSGNDDLAEEVLVLKANISNMKHEHEALLAKHELMSKEKDEIFGKLQEASDTIAERNYEISRLTGDITSINREKTQLEQKLAEIGPKTAEMMKSRMEALKADYTLQFESLKSTIAMQKDKIFELEQLDTNSTNGHEVTRLKMELTERSTENVNIRRRLEQIEKSTSLKLRNIGQQLLQVNNELDTANGELRIQKDENRALTNELSNLRGVMDIAEESIDELHRLREDNERLHHAIMTQHDQGLLYTTNAGVPFEIKKRSEDNSVVQPEDDCFMHERVSALMRENEHNNISMRSLQSENGALKHSIEECSNTISLMQSEINELKTLATDGMSRLRNKKSTLVEERQNDQRTLHAMQEKLQNANNMIQWLRSSQGRSSNDHRHQYADLSSSSNLKTPREFRCIGVQRSESKFTPFDSQRRITSPASLSTAGSNTATLERRFAAELSAEKELRYKAEEICAGVLANSKSGFEERDAEIKKLRLKLFKLSSERY
jgi:uncharacterized small protein (DUF1192 family)